MKSGHFQILTFNHLSLNNCHVGLAWALLREMCRQQRAAIGQNRHFYHSFPAFEELPSRPAARPPPSSSFWLAAFRGISKAAADVDATLSDWFGPLTPLSVRPSVRRPVIASVKGFPLLPPHIALHHSWCTPASTKPIFVAMPWYVVLFCFHPRTAMLAANWPVCCPRAFSPIERSNPSKCPTTTTPPVRCVSRLLHCTSASLRGGGKGQNK